jgi:hypothetical protein
MQKFANAGPALGGENGWPPVFWLAGLLEGEGSFMRGAPSAPAYPIIACRMTDLDTVELVAAAFGTSVQAIEKGRHKTEFAASLRGSRAAELMRLLRPMMSLRRQRAIDQALNTYTPPVRKLDFAKAQEIRKLEEQGETITSLSRLFGVSRPTVRAVLNGRLYPVPGRFPWRPLSFVIRGATAAGTGLNWKELYWLAGWLEAEGSFCKPPPSSPRKARIHAGSTDRDVIQEVARLLCVTARGERSRASHWSPYWRLLLGGGRAITVMQAIRPVMGQRRSSQIDAAIASAKEAGAKLGWDERQARGPNAPVRPALADEYMEPPGVEPGSSGFGDRLLQV